MTLKKEIEHNFGYRVNDEPNFEGLYTFSHVLGRIIPMQSGKSLWIQDCGTMYIIGLWLGYTYYCNSKDDLFIVIQQLLNDTSRSSPHYHMPSNLKALAHEFDIYYLGRNTTSKDAGQNDDDANRKDHSVRVPPNIIEEFLKQRNCQHTLDHAGWGSFHYEDDRLFFRKLPSLQDQQYTTFVNVGIDTKIHDKRSESSFLDDFPKYLMNKGFEHYVQYR